MRKSLILEQLREAKNIPTKRAFALKLGISTQGLNNWYARDTFSPEVIMRAFPDVNMGWLLSGEGEMFIADKQSEAGADVTIPADVWQVIKDQATSLKIKDQQTAEVIAMLREQMQFVKKVAVIPFPAVAEEDE